MPTHEEFRPTVLRVLAKGDALALREIIQKCADLRHLTDEQRTEMLPSGRRSRLADRVSWACSYLTLAGLVDRPRRGYYTINASGRQVDARNLSVYTDAEMEEWPKFRAYQKERAQRQARGSVVASDDIVDPVVATVAPAAIDESSASPLERIEELVRQANDDTETELRRTLQASSSAFFEKAVVDLLWAMGYGGANGEKQTVGRSGDGGIDGVIRQDALGLNNVYIQAKRYGDGNSIGTPAIRDFLGALQIKGAGGGIFITTSTFTQSAIDLAEQYFGKRIILIDGLRLTRLMLAYSVGVQKTQEFTLFEVDSDYFEDEV